MYDHIRDILEGRFESDNHSLSLSCDKIELTSSKGEIIEGSFVIEGESYKEVVGKIYSGDRRLVCNNTEFQGREVVINYTFNTKGMNEGDVIKGNLAIVSNYGEYKLPFVVAIEYTYIDSPMGAIKNLFHYANLAKTNWEYALMVFYNPEFVRLFKNSDYQYLSLYRGLSSIANNEANMDEFLVEIKKKHRVSIIPDKDALEYYDVRTTDIEDVIRLEKRGWGSIDIDISVEGDFIILSKYKIVTGDFRSNIATIGYSIIKDRLHIGKNYGSISIRNSGRIINIPVIVSQSINKASIKNHKRIRKTYLNILKQYIAYRFGRLDLDQASKYISDALEDIAELDSNTTRWDLMSTYILLLKKRVNEARWALKKLQYYFKEEDDYYLYCVHLYLCILSDPEAIETASRIRKIHEVFDSNTSDWRLAYLIIRLPESSMRNIVNRWDILYNQLLLGTTSPIIYIDALSLLNEDPMLLKEINKHNIRVLYYGARECKISVELENQIVYLAGRMKIYYPLMSKLLHLLYVNNGSYEVLELLARHYIRNDNIDKEAHWIYSECNLKGVKITKLYEYYMRSLDIREDVHIHKNVLMYFAYDCNLDSSGTALIYRSIVEYKDDMPTLYYDTLGKIEEFIIKELFAGNINKNLAYLYTNVFIPRMMTEDNADWLANLVFNNELTFNDDSIKKVILIHKRLENEIEYTVVRKKVSLPIFGSDMILLFEDAYGNRCTNADYEQDRLIDYEGIVDRVKPYSKCSLLFNLMICEGSRELIDINSDNVDRYKHIALSDLVDVRYSNDIKLKLIKYYYLIDDYYNVDVVLEGLSLDVVRPKDREEVIHILIVRSMYMKAYAMTMKYASLGLDANTVLKICSKGIEDIGHIYNDKMLYLAKYIFDRKKYNVTTLEYLCMYYEGSSKDLRDIWRAAKSFDIDTYSIGERIIVQVLDSKAYIGEEGDIFRDYIAGGAKATIEMAYLMQSSFNYLIEGKVMDTYFMKDMARVYRRGERLHRVCRLAYIMHYASSPDERNAEIDDIIVEFVNFLIRRRVYMPAFLEFENLLSEIKTGNVNTIIEYRGNNDSRVFIHYLNVVDGVEVGNYKKVEMRNIFGGMFTKSFILFEGEILQYYITEEYNNIEQLTESGSVHNSGERGIGFDNRCKMINDIAISYECHDYRTMETMIKEYKELDYITFGLFKIR